MRKDLDVWISLSKCTLIEKNYEKNQKRNKRNRDGSSTDNLSSRHETGGNSHINHDTTTSSSSMNNSANLFKRSLRSNEKVKPKLRIKSPSKSKVENSRDSVLVKVDLERILDARNLLPQVDNILPNTSFHTSSITCNVNMSTSLIPVIPPVMLPLPLILPDQLFALHRDQLYDAMINTKKNNLLQWIITSILPLCNSKLSTQADSNAIEVAIRTSMVSSSSLITDTSDTLSSSEGKSSSCKFTSEGNEVSLKMIPLLIVC